MFENIKSHQQLADQLKRIVEHTPHTRGQRFKHQAKRAIRLFENEGWHYRAFEDAVKQEQGETRIFDSRGNVVGISDQLTVETIARIIDRYMKLLYPQAGDELTVTEAAAYTGLSEATIRKYVYRTNPPLLTGKLRGRDLVFTRAELDNARQLQHPTGRPRKVTA